MRPPENEALFGPHFWEPRSASHFFWKCFCTWAAHFFSVCTWAAHFFPVCTWAAHFFLRLHLGRTFLFSMQKVFVWVFFVTFFYPRISCEQALSECRTQFFFVGAGLQKVLVAKCNFVGNVQPAATLPRSTNRFLKTKRKPGRRSGVQPVGFGKKVPLAIREQLDEYNCRRYRFQKKEKDLRFAKFLYALLEKKHLVYI